MQKANHKKTNIHNQGIIEHQKSESIRLNKYISDSGFCSRREADFYIESGRVTIDNQIAVVGTKVLLDNVVKVDNKVITPKPNKVYIMLHKPTGITCTNDLDIKDNIRSFVGYKELIFPIGRLDKDSSGLILLTNDGDIVNKILRAEHGHEKEYVVTVDKDIEDDFLKNMASGVIIYNQVSHKNQKTAPCKIDKLDNRTFKLILKQGLNRQIRRMSNALGYNVKSLKRIRVMNIKLGDLKVGEWRYLKDNELTKLNELLKK